MGRFHAAFVMLTLSCGPGDDSARDAAARADAASIADAAAVPDAAPLPCDTGLVIETPAVGHDAYFAMPTIGWQPVAGATGYDVAISTDPQDFDGPRIDGAEGLTDTAWSPTVPHMGSTFYARVTAQPSGAQCVRRYVVRGFVATPDAASAQTFCGGAEGTGLGSAYAAAHLGDRVYTTHNLDGAGVCAYDASSLDYIETLAARGGTMRSWGLTADAAGNRLLVTYYPLLGSCADSMQRLGVIDDPGGDAQVTSIATGIESAHTVVFDGVRAHMSGLFTQSCYQDNFFCLDFGESCPQGAAAQLTWDVADGSEVTHAATPWADPGAAADAARVYRSGRGAEILVADAATGAHLFALEVGDAPRGLVRADLGGKRWLIVSEFDKTLRIYELRADPVASADDIILVNELALAQRYWQPGHDGAETFWFPAQDSRTVVRHRLYPVTPPPR